MNLFVRCNNKKKEGEHILDGIQFYGFKMEIINKRCWRYKHIAGEKIKLSRHP